MGFPFPIAFHMGSFIFQGLTASIIGQSGSLALSAVMRATEIALLSAYSNSKATMDNASEPGVIILRLWDSPERSFL